MTNRGAKFCHFMYENRRIHKFNKLIDVKINSNNSLTIIFFSCLQIKKRQQRVVYPLHIHSNRKHKT